MKLRLSSTEAVSSNETFSRTEMTSISNKLLSSQVLKLILIFCIIDLSSLITLVNCSSSSSSRIITKSSSSYHNPPILSSNHNQRRSEDEVVHVVFSAHGNHSVSSTEGQVIQSVDHKPQPLQKEITVVNQAPENPTSLISHSYQTPSTASSLSPSSSSPAFPLPSTNTSRTSAGRRPAAKGLISAIAYILAQHLETEKRKKSNVTKGVNLRHVLPTNGTTKSILSDVDDDLVTAESSLLSSTTAKSLANWLKDALLGTKWRRKQPDADSEPSDILMIGGHPPPPPLHHFPPHALQPGHPALAPPGHYGAQPPPPFIPPPDGFPSPYSPDSVLLPPELMQDTGIEYWLNFIEQAAVQNEASSDAPQKYLQHRHPPSHDHYSDKYESGSVGIGEKPAKTGPNSIRDELMLDGTESDPENPESPLSNTDRNGHERHRQASMSSSASHASTAEKGSDTAPRCDKFTSHICVDDFEYPEQAIVDEIYKRREIFELMYSDDGSKSDSPMVDGIPRDVEESFVYETYDASDPNSVAASSSSSSVRGSSTSQSKVSGYVCPSEVLYGKPKLARNVNGDWKVIVNAVSILKSHRSC